jgi:hypothetical protein
MKAECIDRKTFQLTDNGQTLGWLTYKNLFSDNAIITLANADNYTIKPVGFLNTSIAVTKDETEVANLKMNWKGQIIISFQDGETFILKAKGAFYEKYIIENMNNEKLIQFDPKFNWSKFNYNYEISYGQKPQDILVLLGVYASNYYIAAMSGAVAAM